MLGWRRNPQQATYARHSQQYNQTTDHPPPLAAVAVAAPALPVLSGSGGAGADGGGSGGGGEKERDVSMYSVTRSVCLPRVALTRQVAPTVTIAGDGVGSADKGAGCAKHGLVSGDGAGIRGCSLGINPLYIEEEDDEDGMQADDEDSGNTKPHNEGRNSRQSTPGSGEKSSSSGYGGSYGSSHEPYYFEHIKSKQDAISILAQNPNYVKSIRIGTACKQDRMNRRPKQPQNGTYGSGSSATTLSTIPEGQVDFTIPRPIWPPYHRSADYDSLVDEAILLYTSLNYKPDLARTVCSELSVKEVLTELLYNVNATIQGTNATTAEEMLKTINRKLESSLEALKNVTEEEMRLLCINLSNSNKVSSVLRAFSTNNSSASTSGNSSQCSPQWNSNNRVRTTSSSGEELYQIPSGSSSSGFSDHPAKQTPSPRQQVMPPVFVHDNLGSVSKGMRNALIYGTVGRSKQLNIVGLSGDKLLPGDGIVSVNSGVEQPPKKSLLAAAEGSKPSVWEQYYGVKPEGGVTTYVPKPSDVPLYPGGRPEADFTLDVPRSEMLSKRMKADKKWRCRCRVLTSFLGLVFFLLSVMAVSLVLTRGKRMFGSMV